MYKNVVLKKTDDNVYVITADSERFGKQAVIFQSPLESDLLYFLKGNGLCVDLIDACAIEDLRNIEGKQLVGYFRMYYRDGAWAGRWFIENSDGPTYMEICSVQQVINYVAACFPKGCDWRMCEELAEKFSRWGDSQRYVTQVYGNDYLIVAFDTTYGNGDYPVRIYLYR